MATTKPTKTITNIVGEGFPEEIIEQINVRQKKKGLKKRITDNNPQNLVWQNSNTGWVKLISSVDVLQSRYDILKQLNSNIPLQGKTDLAKEFVLMGGVYNQATNTMHSGIARDKSVINDNAYGLGGVEFGIVPMPGITSFNIKTETRGSLKTATIGIKAYNRTQFDIINMLYLSLGYSVLVEWGNTMYYDNKENFIENNQYSLADEFLSNDITNKWTKILPEIQKRRINSNGNYDAALCKVVNFTWSIDKDLSYNITVTLRTIGDVIESLKMNTLSGNVGLNASVDKAALDQGVNNFIKSLNPLSDLTSPTTTTQASTTQASTTPATTTTTPATTSQQTSTTSEVPPWAQSTDIGKFLYVTQQNIQFYAPNTNYIKLWNNGGKVDAVSVDYEGAPNNGTQYYVRLGYFLDILQLNILPKLKKNNLQIINIYTNVQNNIIATYDRQISADPSICLIKASFDRPVTTVEFLPGAEDFKYTPSNSEYSYGYFMNVYFNMQYIIDRMTQLTDKEGKLILIDFLKIFSDGFCRATGNYNKIEPTVDDEYNIIKFIDEIQIPNRDNIIKSLSPGSSTKLAEFQIFGYRQVGNDSIAGIVRDLNFTTTVTPNLASMITIGAQANGYITGQDSTALSTLNNGLVDRVKEEFVDPLSTSPTGDNIADLETKYKEPLDAFNIFLDNLGSVSGAKPKWDPVLITNFVDSNVAFCEYDQYKSTLEKKKTNPNASSPIIGFIPFNLSLTMDGLSGIKVYQKFTINSQFLPSNYPDTLEFIVKGITNEIKDNQWITTIESLAIPKNPFSTKVIRKKQTSNFTASTPNPPSSTSSPNVAPPGNAPLLYNAVKQQAEYLFKTFGETPGACGRYSYNIALKLKQHISTNSQQAITFDTLSGSGGNTNESSFRRGVMNLDFYDQVYVGTKTIPELKKWVAQSTFNYGDILNYYSPGHSGPTNMHAQIYTGNIFSTGGSVGKNKNIIPNSAGNSGWSTSTKTNYGSPVLYGKSPFSFEVYLFKVKPQYIK